MSQISPANDLASAVRQATMQRAKAAHRATQPEHLASNSLGVTTQHTDGSSSGVQFDATGQIVPTGKANNRHSGTASLISLLA